MDPARAFAHVKQIVECGPRPAGSAALAKCADYIEAELKKLGLKLQRQRFREPEAAPGIEFCNLWTQIDGADPANTVRCWCSPRTTTAR